MGGGGAIAPLPPPPPLMIQVTFARGQRIKGITYFQVLKYEISHAE